MYRTTFFILSLIAVFSFGCTKKSASSDSKTLTAYVSLEEALGNDLAKAFQKETGVALKFVRLSTGEAEARMEAEKNNPQASIWIGGVGLGHSSAKHKGLTTPHTSAALNKIPAEFRDPKGYWNGIYVGTLVFAGNTARLKEFGLKMPKSWNDLLDAKWKNRLQIPNPGTSGTSYNMLSMLVKDLGEEKAFSYMKKLHSNISQYTRSGSAPAKNVAIGEATLAIGYAHDIIRLIHESKAPLVIQAPIDGTGFEVAATSLIKGAKDIELAKQFNEWLRDKTASQIFADYYMPPLVNQDEVTLKPHTIKPGDIKLIPVDADWAGKERGRLIEKWNDQVNG